MERLDQTTILKIYCQTAGSLSWVIYLYYYLDLGTREIAEATGAPGRDRSREASPGKRASGEYLIKEGLAQ